MNEFEKLDETMKNAIVAVLNDVAYPEQYYCKTKEQAIVVIVREIMRQKQKLRDAERARSNRSRPA